MMQNPTLEQQIAFQARVIEQLIRQREAAQNAHADCAAALAIAADRLEDLGARHAALEKRIADIEQWEPANG